MEEPYDPAYRRQVMAERAAAGVALLLALGGVR